MNGKTSNTGKIITAVLRVSSLISTALMTAGLALFLSKPGQVSGIPSIQVTGLREALMGSLHMEPVALMTLGIIILITTPLLRVTGFLLSFWFLEKDRRYALVSLGVLAILTVSLLIPGIKG